MSGYARPAGLDEALELLAEDGAVPLRRRHRPRRPDRPRDPRAGRSSSTSSDAGLGGDRARRDGRRASGRPRRSRSSPPRRSSSRTPPSRPRPALAASPLLRNVGTVGGNLCQHTRCWYYRGVEWHCWLGGGDTCYAQIGDHRKHGLEPGDCISAHPSDLAPALAAVGATVVDPLARAAPASCRCSSSTGARRPRTARSLALEPGELVVAVRLPAPPDASAYLRAGERQAFSFPLVSVAAARRGDAVRLVAAGSRTSRASSTRPTRSPACPATRRAPGSDGVLETLVERAVAAVSPRS